MTFASSIPTTALIRAEANSALRPYLVHANAAVMLAGVTDVTDATFATAVIERSMTVPVVVDLWAEWCGPCKTLGPIIEKVIDETNGAVELAKVDVDANPQVAQAFGVQSIPAVFAIREGKIVDTFVGALPESAVREFVEKSRPGRRASSTSWSTPGDEASLRAALELDATNVDAAVALGDLLRNEGSTRRGRRGPHPVRDTCRRPRPILARVRLQRSGVSLDGDLDLTLEHLLEQSARTNARAPASSRSSTPSDPRIRATSPFGGNSPVASTSAGLSTEPPL